MDVRHLTFCLPVSWFWAQRPLSGDTLCLGTPWALEPALRSLLPWKRQRFASEATLREVVSGFE